MIVGTAAGRAATTSTRSGGWLRITSGRASGGRMGLKVCNADGCPRLQPQSRCAEHRRESERKRGSTAERGYGSAHVRLRAHYQRRMDAGERFTCWRCPREIDPSNWHLGHDDHDRSKYRGPECVPCNTATMSRIAPGA